MDINLLITGSGDHVKETIRASPENTLFTGSVKLNNESFLYFSFVNKDSLSYILNDINLENGVEVEITRHDANAENLQPEKDLPPCL